MSTLEYIALEQFTKFSRALINICVNSAAHFYWSATSRNVLATHCEEK